MRLSERLEKIWDWTEGVVQVHRRKSLFAGFCVFFLPQWVPSFADSVRWVLKAHGHTPAWTRDHALSAASREALRIADLTFHDLRHEAGSRLLEAGWPLHNVAHMLGHANISQTSTYLNATRVGLQDAMRRLDASRCKPVATGTETDRAPHGNDGDADADQPLVN